MKIKLFVIFLFCMPAFLMAQLNSYWGENFNSKGSLMSGAIVGGNADETSIMYNPSLIGDQQESRLAISFSLVTLTQSKANNFLGEGIEADELTSTLQPRFFSFFFYPDSAKKWVIEIGAMTKESYYFKYVNNYVADIDIISVAPGDEQYNGLFKSETDYKTYWYGIGASRIVNDKLRLGASLFGVVKNYDFNKSLNVSAITNSLPVNYTATNYRLQYFDAYDVRLALKIGAHYIFNPKVQMGINVNIPTIRVFGSADAYSSILQENNYNPEAQEPLDNIGGTSYSPYIPTDFKDPFNLSLGLNYTISKKSMVSTTWSYYAPLNEYAFIDGSRAEDIDNVYLNTAVNGQQALTYVNGAKEIINFAFGTEYFYSEQISFLTGFKTNFNASLPYIDDKENSAIVLSDVDLYNLSLGSYFSYKQFDILLGIQYTFGRDINNYQDANLTSPMEYNPVIEEPLLGTPTPTSDYHYNQVGLFFGLTFKTGGNKLQ